MEPLQNFAGSGLKGMVRIVRVLWGLNLMTTNRCYPYRPTTICGKMKFICINWVILAFLPRKEVPSRLLRTSVLYKGNR